MINNFYFCNFQVLIPGILGVVGGITKKKCPVSTNLVSFSVLSFNLKLTYFEKVTFCEIFSFSTTATALSSLSQNMKRIDKRSI